MTQQAAKWRFAGYVSNQFDGRRIESHWYSDRLIFLGRQHGLKFEVAVENPTAGSVDTAHGRPELPIRVGRNVFSQEVHQPAIALEQGEQLDRPIQRFRRWLIA